MRRYSTESLLGCRFATADELDRWIVCLVREAEISAHGSELLLADSAKIGLGRK